MAPDFAASNMKAIWTLIFLAVIATTAGLPLLFIPENSRTETFLLSLGAVVLAEFFMWIAFTFRGTQRSEQASGMSKISLLAVTTLYFVAAVALALVALSGLPFKVLLALHIVAMLGLVIVAGLSAIATRALIPNRD